MSPSINYLDLEVCIGRFNDIERRHLPRNLFYKGNQDLLFQKRRVAVEGSRYATKKGISRVTVVAKSLVEHDITAVSGLASGIDTAAHLAAIENKGSTIAVLGTPIDQLYPKENAKLLETIKTHHLAISQFPKGHPFHSKNFPMRNRTMALISDAVVVIEASKNSGTRYLAWEALRLGREVYMLKDVASDPEVEWACEIIQYGADILDLDLMDKIFSDIPFFTSSLPENAF